MRGGAFLPFTFVTPQEPQDMEGVGGWAGLSAQRGLTASITSALPRTPTDTEVADLTSVIASTPTFSIFTSVPTEATRRRDRYMYPLNTDYDLFSLGPNGRTAVSLGESVGQDDVIRAHNGGFFGLASEY